MVSLYSQMNAFTVSECLTFTISSVIAYSDVICLKEILGQIVKVILSNLNSEKFCSIFYCDVTILLYGNFLQSYFSLI